MRILLLHTYYERPGGEDTVFEAEKSLLERTGHEVLCFTLDNRELGHMPPWRRAAVSVWNGVVYHKLRTLIREWKPQVVHIHNTFPLSSPAVIDAAKTEGLPVVMTLHNYRLLCVNALFFRHGRVCEDCLGHLPWRGLVHGCYRGSRAASGVVAGMLALHRLLGTWSLVDRFIALTEFMRQKFIQAGFLSAKMVVKPNFVSPDPGVGGGRGGCAVFVGRLSTEKGLGTLLEAWKRLDGKLALKIIGDGPLTGEVRRAAERMSGVEWLGRRAPQEVRAVMGDALFLVFPSEWYEGFPLVIGEAFARGLPVVATALGSQGSLVENGRTGVLFRPGDPEDLAAKVEWLLSHPAELARMRKEARAEYEAKYTAERNYQMLMEIYQQAIENHRRGS